MPDTSVKYINKVLNNPELTAKVKSNELYMFCEARFNNVAEVLPVLLTVLKHDNRLLRDTGLHLLSSFSSKTIINDVNRALKRESTFKKRVEPWLFVEIYLHYPDEIYVYKMMLNLFKDTGSTEYQRAVAVEYLTEYLSRPV